MVSSNPRHPLPAGNLPVGSSQGLQGLKARPPALLLRWVRPALLEASQAREWLRVGLEDRSKLQGLHSALRGRSKALGRGPVSSRFISRSLRRTLTPIRLW